MKAAPLKALWEPPPEEPPEGADLTDAPEPAAKEGDTNWPIEVLRTRLVAQGLLAAGMFLTIAGLRLLKRRRYFVLCYGPGAVMKVRANSESQQTQILMTVQAVLG
jgi:hypothetical protein